MRTPFTQSGWIVEADGSPLGNFEAIFACTVDTGFRGLRHLWWNNAGLSDPTRSPDSWMVAETITNDRMPGPWLGASLIFSNYNNIEIVTAHNDGLLAHFYLYGIWGWQGPVMLPGTAAGPPAFIQSHNGRRGNFEVIVPKPGGGLSHFWRNNDAGEVWAAAPPPITSGTWSGVALIHSNFGNLELVGVMNNDLVFMWQNGTGGPWSSLAVLARGYRGRPAFIQSTYGRRGNFEVVAASINGGLHHFWRNNDLANMPWSGPIDLGFRPEERGYRTYEDVTMFQSDLTHLEVYGRGFRETLVDWFRARVAEPWTEFPETFGFPCG